MFDYCIDKYHRWSLFIYLSNGIIASYWSQTNVQFSSNQYLNHLVFDFNRELQLNIFPFISFFFSVDYISLLCPCIVQFVCDFSFAMISLRFGFDFTFFCFSLSSHRGLSVWFYQGRKKVTNSKWKYIKVIIFRKSLKWYKALTPRGRSGSDRI